MALMSMRYPAASAYTGMLTVNAIATVNPNQITNRRNGCAKRRRIIVVKIAWMAENEGFFMRCYKSIIAYGCTMRIITPKEVGRMKKEG
jgi:hypothetical protein